MVDDTKALFWFSFSSLPLEVLGIAHENSISSLLSPRGPAPGKTEINSIEGTNQVLDPGMGYSGGPKILSSE